MIKVVDLRFIDKVFDLNLTFQNSLRGRKICIFLNIFSTYFIWVYESGNFDSGGDFWIDFDIFW